LHRDVVFIRDVFDKLLGNGRAAADKVLYEAGPAERGPDGALPVDAVVLEKSRVFDRDKSIFQVFRYLAVIRPYAVFRAVQLFKLDRLPRLLVRIVDKACKV